jgi:tetratricopeptide (TPR) repeat protein
LAARGRRQGKLDEAAEFLRRELQVAEKIDGPDSESIAESLQNLGVMLRDLGRLDASAPLLQGAVEIIEKIHGTNSIKSAPMLSALAQLCSMRGEYDRAEGMFLKILDTRRRLLPPEDEGIHLVETRLADLYEKMGRSAEAAKFRQRAEIR